MKNVSLASAIMFFATILVAGPAAAQSPPPGAVLTYHSDNFRTGWQQQETVLTSSSFPKQFGLVVQPTPLDGQVDAQPLIVPNQIVVIDGVSSTHDLVYVATESDMVYAIDASSGQILLSTLLGPPVPNPLNCGNNGSTVGINSTPVIDWASQTLFVMAYVNLNGTPTYRLHALHLKTLKNKGNSPVTVAASQDGFTFNATVQRQRPGLLFSNGNVYAGFGSFCDFAFTKSRGWLLGWKWDPSTPSLTPLPSLTPAGGNQLNDKDCPSPSSCPSTRKLLGSIWMSGYGIASDESGNLFFSTGNSEGSLETSPSTWDGVTSLCTNVNCTINQKFTNIQESVVENSPHLTKILGIFSPNAFFPTFGTLCKAISTPTYNACSDTLALDHKDNDFSSGGVLVLPQLLDQQTQPHFLATAAGKDGKLFLFDRANPNPSNTPNWNSLNLLQLIPRTSLGGCWCGPSYFKDGSDGLGRVVTSQSFVVKTWVFKSPPILAPEGRYPISSGQDPGFFTTVSCNTGTPYGSCAKGSAIIWAVSRPHPTTTNNESTAVNLYAFSPLPNPNGNLTLLFGPVSGSTIAQAGVWPTTSGDANIVPTVSNGKVYVASNKQLSIFGICPTTGCISAPVATPIASLTSTFVISGTLQDVKGSALTLKNRKGKGRKIDISQALNNQQVAADLTKGDSFTAVGSSFTPAGSLLAVAIYRAKGTTGDEWPPDKDPHQQ